MRNRKERHRVYLHHNLGSGAENIGLIYVQVGWYLPGIGRFITADTLVLNPLLFS